MKNILFLIVGIFILTGCEKNINIDMPDFNEKLMVEGWITNDQKPVVVLTRNFRYNNTAGTDLYEQSFVHDAIITVTDENGNSEVLTEISVYDKEYDYTAYMYSGDSIYGVSGNTYYLTILTEDKIIESSTYLPQVVNIQEIWQEPHPDATNDSMKIIKCKISDPVGKNYYRYLYKIDGKDGASPEISTIEDTNFEGREYIKAIDSGLDNEDQDIHGGVAGYFYSGDTITVLWFNATKSYYDFWTKIDFSRSTEMSPFMEPTKITGNVKGALGYWCGLGVNMASIILQ